MVSSDVEKSRAVGFTDDVIRPVNVNRLEATLREIARKRGKHQLVSAPDFDNFACPAPNAQSDRAAANAAIFNQILFFLRGVYFEGERFTTMGAGNVGRHG